MVRRYQAKYREIVLSCIDWSKSSHHLFSKLSWSLFSVKSWYVSLKTVRGIILSCLRLDISPSDVLELSSLEKKNCASDIS
jgi:hypothetical protein